MKKGYEPWLFKVPSLPREWYDFLRTQNEHWALTSWHVVILGLAAWKHVQETDPEKAEEMAGKAGQLKPWTRTR